MDNYRAPGQEIADAFATAFSHFNRELFDNRLPECVVHTQRKRGAHGYFWPGQFRDRAGEVEMHEIAMNPDTMSREVPVVLSTLVHEMTHLEQQEYGKPGKGGHHNREWGELMDRVGLTPTSTGAEGGKRTGRKVTHMIVEGGPFDESCQRLMATGFTLPWHTIEALGGAGKAKKTDKSKVKHTCPDCQQRAWAKLGSKLICGECEVPMEAPEMDEDEEG
jgi:predicted SprT family Zn-dependent metalloprotease